jgi:hypothetical protein
MLTATAISWLFIGLWFTDMHGLYRATLRFTTWLCGRTT